MRRHHSRVVSTACPATVTSPVTVSCPTFTTRAVAATPVTTAAVAADTTTTAAAVAPTTAAVTDQASQLQALLPLLLGGQTGAGGGADIASILPLLLAGGQGGQSNLAALLPLLLAGRGQQQQENLPQQVFTDTNTQLAGASPLLGLAATNPAAAAASVSPVLNSLFNPLFSKRAALLGFNPEAANVLALGGGGGFGVPFAKPFGKFGVV